MNLIEIGKTFERQAKGILKLEGFKVVEHKSIKNWCSPYDFIISKEGVKYYLEVRGRLSGNDQNYFMFSKRKLELLGNLNLEVLIMLINKEGYLILKLEDIPKYKKLIQIKNRRIYVIDTPLKIKLPKRDPPLFCDCDKCGKIIKGFSKKQINARMKLHLYGCKGVKE